MKRLALALALVLAPAPALAERPSDVRVGLYRHAPPAVLAVSAPSGWEARNSRSRLRLRPGATLTVRAQAGRVVATMAGRVALSGPELTLEAPSPWLLQADHTGPRRFEGRLVLRAERDRLVPILTQDLEAYLKACVGAEMPPDWPTAALRAQAIASRTYALAQRDRHQAQGFDLCDLTHCQRYRGLAGADARVSAAVEATRGQRLVFRDRPLDAVWHSACGGFRAPNEIVFGGAANPTLRGGFDGPAGGAAWCRDAKASRWSFETDAATLTRALRAAGLLAAGEPLSSLTVADRTAGGYAATVRVEGRHTRSLTGYALWAAVGPHFRWGDLKSPAFNIRRTGSRYVFEGRGLGHGVGMCQWGARGQALAGKSPQAILAFYFPGTTLR